MSRSCRALTAWLISFVCLFELVHGIVKTRASCTSSSGFIVNSQSDIDSGPIHGCTTLYGDIVMDNAAGNFSFLESGVVNVHGSIYLRNNSGVEYLDLADILSISTSFTALNAAKLKFLSFDSSLAQLPYISLQGLPNVGSVYVSNVTRMVSLSIVDTGVDSLSFGVLKTIKDITFLNNFQMDSTTLGFDVLTNITGNFIAMNNSQPERGISMRIPYLSYMNNATWDSLWELDLEELVQVNDSLSISNSQSLMTQIQLPLLTSVGGSFVVRNNPGIITIAATGLQHVGDLVVENNAKLSDLAQMRELEDAKSITLSGYGFNEYVHPLTCPTFANCSNAEEPPKMTSPCSSV